MDMREFNRFLVLIQRFRQLELCEGILLSKLKEMSMQSSQSIDESENNDYLGRLGEVAPDATAAAAAAKTSLLRRESREGLFSRRDDMLRLPRSYCLHSKSVSAQLEQLQSGGEFVIIGSGGFILLRCRRHVHQLEEFTDHRPGLIYRDIKAMGLQDET
uniref:Uncharacterized protein n=1 Tax=Pristionchus pacificus TaxID=54126 RepID=A0A2A6BK31_PRIPA|eukprot:PDM66272.1 hypothetical protein PRIPAC_45497 [Pristionchus pacificus]